MRLDTLFIFALLFVACSGRDGSAADSAAQRPPVSMSPSPTDTAKSASSSIKPACPGTGKWAVCSIERRLKQSGFVVKPMPADTAKRPGFSVRPRVYMLGKSRLEVFLYDSEDAVTKDAAALDTVAAAPRGIAGIWEGQPLFMRSANLAAVLLSQDARQIERVQLAITAGPPGPGASR